MKKKLLSLALVLAMALTLLPTAAFAADLNVGDVTYEDGIVSVGVPGAAADVTEDNVDSKYTIKYIINASATPIPAADFETAEGVETAQNVGVLKNGDSGFTFQSGDLEPGTYYIHVLVSKLENGSPADSGVATSAAVIVPAVIAAITVDAPSTVTAGGNVSFTIASATLDGDDEPDENAKLALEVTNVVWKKDNVEDTDADATTAPATPGEYSVEIAVGVIDAEQDNYVISPNNVDVVTKTITVTEAGSDDPIVVPAPTNVTIDISTLEVSWDTDEAGVTEVSIKFFIKNADGEYESASSPAGMTVTDANTILAKKVALTGVTVDQLNGRYVGVALTTDNGTSDFAYNEYEIVIGAVASYELTVTRADYSNNSVDLAWTLDEDPGDMTFTYCVHEDLSDISSYLRKGTVTNVKKTTNADDNTVSFTGQAKWSDALDEGTYYIVLYPDNASPTDGSHNDMEFTVEPANPNFTDWGYDVQAQNAWWMFDGKGTPKFALTLDGKTFNGAVNSSSAGGVTTYTCKIEQKSEEQTLVVVCNGNTDSAIKILIPAAVPAEEVAGAIKDAVSEIAADTTAEEVAEIIADAMGTSGNDPTADVSTATLTDTDVVKALREINRKRNISLTVTGNQSGSVTEAMKQWIAANADAGTQVAIEQKSAPKPAASKLPQDYRNKKIAAISVEVKFDDVVMTEFGMSFPVVLPLPSGYSSNLRVLHYHGDSDEPIVRIPVVDGGSLIVLVDRLSDFAIVDIDSSSSGGGVSSGSSVSGSLSGVSKPASKPSTPAAPAAPSAPANIFSDVPAAHTFASQIKWALDNGVMGGYADGSFRPDNNTSRQQLWMVLGRLAGNNPADMAAAREWAVAAGISDGSNAQGAMSRQQLVTMLYRFAQSQGKAVSGAADLSAYSDSAAVASYAQEALAWAVGNGIVTGTSDGRLNPEGTASRAHFAAFLYRFSNMG